MMAFLREPESSFSTKLHILRTSPHKVHRGESKEDVDLLWMYNAVILGDEG